jgi:hypothetical protein
MTDPSAIPRRGAALAAGISVAWLTVFVVLSGLLAFLMSDLRILPLLGAIGAAAAIPIAATLGWCFGGSFAINGGSVLWMTLLAVFGTAVFIATVFGVAVGASLAGQHWHEGLSTAVFHWLGGVLLGTTYYVAIGLLIFGLPGLVAALISSVVWHRLMRRRFSNARV